MAERPPGVNQYIPLELQLIFPVQSRLISVAILSDGVRFVNAVLIGAVVIVLLGLVADPKNLRFFSNLNI